MSAMHLSTVAYDVIESSGNAAKNVVQAYRASGQRMAQLVAQRWDTAFAQSRPQLSVETAKNATAAKHLVGSFYTKGLISTTNGATDVIAKLVKLAGASVQSALGNAQRLQTKTGIKTIDTLAQVSLPSLVAISTLASSAEQQTATLARKAAEGSVLRVAKLAAKRSVKNTVRI